MTMSEFKYDICSFGDLKDFCEEQRLDFCDELYSDEARDNIIDDDVSYYLKYYGWRDVESMLYNQDTDRYDWWIRDEDDDWHGACDGDFDELFEQVLDYCLNEGIITPDEEEDDDEAQSSESDCADSFDPAEIDYTGLMVESYSSFAPAISELERLREEQINNNPTPVPDKEPEPCEETYTMPPVIEEIPASPDGILF